MKRIFLPLLFLLVLFGCSSEPVHDELLNIESLMETNPHAALAALDSLQTTPIRRTEDKAMFALLYSQALDKNYIDVANDSLIIQAVQFFDKSDNLRYQMLSHYYHGRVHYNAKEYPRSLISMLKALDLAEQIEDYYWHGRIAEQIANIYDANFHTEDAIFYAKTAFNSLQKSGRQPYINYALFSLARVYNNNDKCNEAIKYTKQVLDSAYLYNDSILLSMSNDLLAIAYVGVEDFHSAIDCFARIKERKKLNDNMLSLYGLSHLAIGNIEHARAVFEEMHECSTKDQLSLTYQIHKKNGDYKSALNVLSNLYDKLKITFISVREQNFGQALDGLYAEEVSKQKEVLRRSHLLRKIYFGIGVLMLIVAIVICIYLYKYTNTKIHKNILIAQNLEEILKIKESGLAQANETIQKLMGARFEIIDNLCKIIYEHKATGLIRKKISAEIEALIEQMSSDSKKISEYEQILNEHCSGLMASFRADLPNLKREDYLLFLYTALGFSISAIALFLKVDKLEVIYNRKARLKNKIRKLNTENAAKFMASMT